LLKLQKDTTASILGITFFRTWCSGSTNSKFYRVWEISEIDFGACILALKSGIFGNNFNDFPDNQLPKFSEVIFKDIQFDI